jgi:hypothetical protein
LSYRPALLHRQVESNLRNRLEGIGSVYVALFVVVEAGGIILPWNRLLGTHLQIRA